MTVRDDVASIGVKALPRSTAEEKGVSSSALLDFVEAADREIDSLHSLMVLRHGKVIAEGWWAPYGPTRPHMLYSLSKSFTSTAAGLAIGEGLLNLDDRVVDFFPEDLPADSTPFLGEMRVRHLLTMTTGHTQDTLGAIRAGGDASWVASFLRQPVTAEPGTHFLYNSGATYMVSAIVQKVTGQTLVECLTPRLFEPLGIVGARWESCPSGINTGGWGLNVRTEDIAKFGQLYLQDGVWEGERLLPEGWVAAASAKQVPNGDEPASDWAQGYGFQFWRCRDGIYRGDGAFGQYCIVMPEQDAVLAITAGVRDMQGVLNLVWDRLLPALGSGSLAADAAAQARLRERLAGLKIAGVAGIGKPSSLEVSGRRYRFGDSAQGVKCAALHFEGPTALLAIEDGRGEDWITCGLDGIWVEGVTTVSVPGFGIPQGTSVPVVATGAWTDDRTFMARLCFVETPYYATITCRFEGDRMLLDIRTNVAFGPAEWPQMVGVAESATI